MFDDPWLLLPPTVTDDPLGTPQAFSPRTNLWRDEPAVDPVLRGLAHNPAAPTDVLPGLLDGHGDALSDAFNRRADLPPVVVEATLRHPSARIRTALAANRYVDAAMGERYYVADTLINLGETHRASDDEDTAIDVKHVKPSRSWSAGTPPLPTAPPCHRRGRRGPIRTLALAGDANRPGRAAVDVAS